MLSCQKHLFNIPEGVVYLNCAYRAPMLNSVREAGEKGLIADSEPWKLKPDEFFTHAETLRSLFAQLLGCSADDVGLVPSVSYGIQTAAANIPIKSSQNIVVLSEQYPSNIYPWQDLAKKNGAEILTVKRDPVGDWTPGVLAAIGKQTAIVALPYCHWTDGSVVNLVKVSEKVREVGAALVLDVTQSLGAAKFDFAAIKPDFLVAAGYKWLLGSYSIGYLYAAKKWHEAKPIEFNWKNRSGSEDFTNLVNYRDSYQKGARRFDFGQVSNLVLLPMSIAALSQIVKWGVANVHEALSVKTDFLATELQKLGLQIPPKHLRLPHMFGARFSKDIPADFMKKMNGHGIFVSLRGTGVRISPHLHNTQQDLEFFVEKMASI